jgi:hypothetical protein
LKGEEHEKVYSRIYRNVQIMVGGVSAVIAALVWRLGFDKE